jgi:hypothetical protein
MNKQLHTICLLYYLCFQVELHKLRAILPEEKAGQMNQYNGSWDFTGPKPVGVLKKKKIGAAIKKMASNFKCRGVKEVRAVQDCSRRN